MVTNKIFSLSENNKNLLQELPDCYHNYIGNSRPLVLFLLCDPQDILEEDNQDVIRGGREQRKI